jgi:hypothetical protein
VGFSSHASTVTHLCYLQNPSHNPRTPAQLHAYLLSASRLRAPSTLAVPTHFCGLQILGGFLFFSPFVVLKRKQSEEIPGPTLALRLASCDSVTDFQTGRCWLCGRPRQGSSPGEKRAQRGGEEGEKSRSLDLVSGWASSELCSNVTSTVKPSLTEPT